MIISITDRIPTSDNYDDEPEKHCGENPHEIIPARHPAWSTMKPRTSCPSAAPTMPNTSVNAANIGNSRVGNHCAASVNVHTTVGAAPNPIRIRVSSATFVVCDIANRNDATVQSSAPTIRTDRAPKRDTKIPAGICSKIYG